MYCMYQVHVVFCVCPQGTVQATIIICKSKTNKIREVDWPSFFLAVASECATAPSLFSCLQTLSDNFYNFFIHKLILVS